MAIEITDKARTRLRRLLDTDSKVLRLAVTQGGCSGMTYQATIEDTTNDGDQLVHEEPGLRIVADERSALFLDGLLVDYSDDLIKAGFRLSNPVAKQSCGCGASFAV